MGRSVTEVRPPATRTAPGLSAELLASACMGEHPRQRRTVAVRLFDAKSLNRRGSQIGRLRRRVQTRGHAAHSTLEHGVVVPAASRDPRRAILLSPCPRQRSPLGIAARSRDEPHRPDPLDLEIDPPLLALRALALSSLSQYATCVPTLQLRVLQMRADRYSCPPNKESLGTT
jgi:hypothetical protein